MLINRTQKIIKNSGISFGTSGARGLVKQFSPEVCSAFTYAFVHHVRKSFDVRECAIGIDNRPSSLLIARACAAALAAQGIKVKYFGVLPTPALAYQSLLDGTPCIMVTGSHIPFDRNGLKFYTPLGEISKADESAILGADIEFEAISELPTLIADKGALVNYVARYTSLFKERWLTGKRIGIYEHSSAGRDIYSELFRKMGAEVVSLGRSDEFVPIDTEAVSETDLHKANMWIKEYGLDCVFSTDGDGDRPLFFNEKGCFIRGDILGLVAAHQLGIGSVAVPISCNTSIESSGKFSSVIRTKIGSPFVIQELNKARDTNIAIAGFEANGGFLLGSDISFENGMLRALPTRDAVLPVIMLLYAARDTLTSDLLELLPKRHTYSSRIKNFPTATSLAILDFGIEKPQELIGLLDISGQVVSVDNTDGLRLTLSTNDVVHIRPSGNAPELRCYAESSKFEISKCLVEKSLKNINKIEV